MFTLDLVNRSGILKHYVYKVNSDSLYEAEHLALQIVSKHFSDKKIMLVHKDNLIYDIFEITEPIGQVAIKVE